MILKLIKLEKKTLNNDDFQKLLELNIKKILKNFGLPKNFMNKVNKNN